LNRLRYLLLASGIVPFLILATSGRGYPLLNPYPAELVVTESCLQAERPDMIFVPEGLLRQADIRISAFELCRFETSLAQYDLFCAFPNRPLPPDQGRGREGRPAACISWYDAVEYCNWLSAQEGLKPCYSITKTVRDPGNINDRDPAKWLIRCDFDANGYRLPTEAEWEYAASGGLYSNGYTYSGSEDLEEVGWYSGNASRYPQRIGMKKPNELGLFDMSGNVYEWTWDWYSEKPEDIDDNANDPAGPESGANKAIRGGSCFFDKTGARVEHRKSAAPYIRLPYLGFRVARSMPSTKLP